MEREKILSEQGDVHNLFERKAHLIKPSKIAQLRRKLSEAQSELDRREWKVQNPDIALCETGVQLQSQRLELHQAKAGLVMNWK